jgi:hypothetical protein
VLRYVAATKAFSFRTALDTFGAVGYFSSANGIKYVNLRSSTDAVGTSLASNITLTQTSIALTSAAGLPASGSVVIGVTDTSNGGPGEQRVQ